MTYRVWLPIIRRDCQPSKRGVGATTGGCPVATDAESLRLLGVSWAFVWHPHAPAYNGIEMVPMIRDGRHVGDPLGGNSEYVLGFNEPDVEEPFGCDMSPGVAAVLWREIEELYPERKLVSPATVSDRGWLRRMVHAYRDRFSGLPRFDALSMHCYNPDDWLGDCQRGVALLSECGAEWGVPEGIWVNEFANPWDSGAAQIDAMRAMMALLENDARVDRYAWFAARYEDQAWAPGWNTQLLECGANRRTALGEGYTMRQLWAARERS